MRKLLANNPHIKQQSLHRRVVFEKIDPKVQALTIYISYFVKTSHFEEYLNVQDAVILVLLRIVGNHRAKVFYPDSNSSEILWQYMQTPTAFLWESIVVYVAIHI
uniref:Mechanosensitive ion channel protein 2/3 C-terminal domain-containing protein n=1 Tax=Oryza brachyantha TaxID=4533 RepID=J3LQ13_ORYBR